MARRSGVSLGTKLVLGTVLLLAAAVATSAWYGLKTMKELARASGDARRADLEEAIQREAMLLTRNAAASAASLIGNNDYGKMGETAQKLADENEDLVWIVLIDNQGQVGASSKDAPKKLGETYEDELSQKIAAAEGSVVEQSAKGDDQLLLGAPVFVKDDTTGKSVRVGEVRLAVDTSTLSRARDEAVQDGQRRAAASRRAQLIVALIILLVGVLLGAWQAMRIASPLRALSAQARHIASGDFARRVQVTRGDEVGELGESFNIMAESLGQLVDELTRKAGLEREIEVARSIQGLMTPPPDVMTLGAFKLTGRCEMASACGGDWWSYRTLSDGRLLVVVGDVTGHGMPSAMIAATGRGAVEALAMVDHTSLSPKLVLQAIDRAIRDVGGRRLLMTSFALIISPDGSVAFANGGHTFPYVMRRSGNTVELSILPVRSNPLGSNNPLIATGEHKLTPGDFMILTSDGLTDRVSESGSRYGDKRLRKALVDQVGKASTDIASLCDRIVEEVNEFGGQQPVDDDITLVVVQYTGTATDSGETRVRRETKERGVAA
jgi:sigma-B regulation protein RsbU (phosphoserine phosphatase)